MRLRDALRAVDERTGASLAVLAARRRLRARTLTVLTWHRVDDPAAAADVDHEVVAATPRGFAHQVDLIARRFAVLSLAELEQGLAGGTLPGNPALLTFDDGYLDNHEQALPILLRAGVPATFFIATGPLTERRPFWWDAASWIIKHARRRRLALGYPAPATLDLDAVGTAGAIHACLDTIKDTRALDIRRYLEELARAGDAPWDVGVERALAGRLLMTWDHVRALAGAGMDVASHTRSHRVLQTVPPGELDDELRGSRQDLARELGHAPRAIAYPCGPSIADDPGLRRAVSDAGYTLGFTFLTGFQPLPVPDRLSLRRVAVDLSVSDGQLGMSLASLGRL